MLSKSEVLQLKRKMNELWTVKDVAQYYDKTPMAIHLWCRRNVDPLIEDQDYFVIEGFERSTLRFVPENVKTWAARNGYKRAWPQASKPIKRYRFQPLVA